MKFSKEDLYAELGVLLILGVSLAALLYIYYHYRADYKWAAPLSHHELTPGQTGYWQYDTLLTGRQLHETISRNAQNFDEAAQGSTISVNKVAELWALVQKDDTLYLTQRFPSYTILYGSPAQRILETYIEPDPAKYRVMTITPEQRQWLARQLQDHPGRNVQQDVVLQYMNYPRTTVLLSLPFLLLACGGLSLTLLYYACGLRNLLRRLRGGQRPGASLEIVVPCQQHTKPIVIVATLLFLGYLLLLQL